MNRNATFKAPASSQTDAAAEMPEALWSAVTCHRFREATCRRRRPNRQLHESTSTNRCEASFEDRSNPRRVRLPRPVRHERGEGRGEGCFTATSGPSVRSASSPQPPPPFRTEEREPDAPMPAARAFAKTITARASASTHAHTNAPENLMATSRLRESGDKSPHSKTRRSRPPAVRRSFQPSPLP